MQYVDELLDALRKSFCDWINPTHERRPTIEYEKIDSGSFNKKYEKMYEAVMQEYNKKKTEPKAMRTFDQTDKGKKLSKDKSKNLKKDSAAKKGKFLRLTIYTHLMLLADDQITKNQEADNKGQQRSNNELEQDGDSGSDDNIGNITNSSDDNPLNGSTDDAAVGVQDSILEEGEIMPTPTKAVNDNLPPNSPLEEGEFKLNQLTEEEKQEIALKYLGIYYHYIAIIEYINF